MLKKISLKDFKCFAEEQEFPLSHITVLYGKNGRGKSTVSQSLLLLAQTMIENNDIVNLQLVGKFVSLGTFNDVLNHDALQKKICIELDGESEKVLLEFEQISEKPQMARICQLTTNGVSRFSVNAETNSANESKAKTVSTTSDIRSLQMLKSVRYVSAGRLGPQNFVPRKDSLNDDDLGINGENLINVLSKMGPKFVEQVQTHLSYILHGASIKIKDSDTERIELFLNSKDGNDTFKPVNVGFGYSYVLPVIVATLLASKDSMVIIENPEAHLHPAAQSRITQFLIDKAKENHLQIIIETHSDHVVNGVRIAMRENEIEPKDAHILYFSDTKPFIKMITCDENGSLSDYPDDFLDEWTMQMLKLV